MQSPFDQIRHGKRRSFLASLVESGGNVTRACQIAEIDRSTPYTRQWQEDEEYLAALAVAKRMGAEQLEAEALRRGFEGVEEPVGWYKGQPGGYIRRYSDNLLMFALKGAMPEKYADRVELRGSLASLDLTQLPDHLLARIAAGEHPMSVLASAEPVAALPASQEDEEEEE